jgi:DNA topoisomerase-2
LEFAKAQSNVILSKKTGGKKKMRLTGIAKLDDANQAGGKRAEECTLILTEVQLISIIVHINPLIKGRFC